MAERVALLDQLTDGRMELGTGRSNAYEQTGLGVDPRDTRSLWEESIAMLPKIWTSDEFEWQGQHWNVPKRRVLPKPFNTVASRSVSSGEKTPSTWCRALAGLVSGPRRLKMVGMASDVRAPATCFIAG